jgi:hypothetical protein
MVNSYARKQEAMRTYEFLLAAAAGDLQGMRNLLAQGRLQGYSYIEVPPRDNHGNFGVTSFHSLHEYLVDCCTRQQRGLL